ncbi:hypothetical protein BJY21_004287 [Kineosphaera limosa]|uniref:Lipoprotein n=1 Tax=Kineosphaera limosa NBRC 100340 TaxID=1184609 RepID=K6W5J3_9MICO|nr:hypothetical protein [Kineosphaera limosa]NYE03103.1 hypothetical protein [Kineosphaera limosa]GAB94440.1 hypothetical protein KILIM_005_00570 [Kineosphaera limosa NBRC 100340]
MSLHFSARVLTLRIVARGRLSLALAVLACSAAFLTAGCASAVSGRVGVAVDDRGQPVLVVISCDRALDEVIVSDATGEIGRWTADPATSGLTTLDPAAPTRLWRGAGISWPQRGEVSVNAASTTTELDGSGVVVAPRWLTQLTAGHVLVGDSGETVPRDQFESTCD